MELEALFEALGSPDRTARAGALRQAVMSAILNGDVATARALTLYRRVLIAVGSPLLDMVLGRETAALRLLSPLPEHLLDGVVLWGHEEGVAQVLTCQDRVISVGHDGAVCQWDERGLLLDEHRWPQAVPRVIAGAQGLFLAVGQELWRWAAPQAPALIVPCSASIKSLVVFGEDVIVSLEGSGLWAWSSATQQLRELNIPGGELACREGLLICLEEGGGLSWGGLDDQTRERLPAPEENSYAWDVFVALRAEGLLVIEHIQDDPGGLYGPMSSWYLFDPLMGQRRSCSEEETQRLPRLGGDGAEVHCIFDGTLRLLAPERAPKPAVHITPPKLAIGQTRMLVADDTWLTTLNFVDGEQLDAVRLAHRDLKALMVTPTGSITMSRYYHPHANDPFVLVRDARGEPVFKLPGGGGYMDWVDASPDGQLLLSRAKSQLNAHLPDGALSWSATVPWQHEQRCAWSPDGREVAILTHGSGVLRVGVEDDSYTVLGADQLDSANFACSPSGERALIFSEHRDITILSLSDGAPLMKIPSHGLHGVSAVALGEDYGVVVDALGHVAIITLNTATLCKRSGKGSLGQIALRQDRALVVGRAGRAEVWDLKQGVLVHALKARKKRSKVEILGGAWLDDDHLVTSDDAGLIQLWSAQTGAPLHELKGHEGAVYAVEALPDGRLISGGDDGRICLWTDWERADASPQVFEPDCGALLSLSSSDAGDVLIGGLDSKKLWTPSNDTLRPLRAHMHFAVLAPDGRSVLAKTMLTRVDVLDAADGAPLTSSQWSWFGSWPEQHWLLPTTEAQERRALLRWRDGLGVITLPQGRVLWRHDQAPDHVALSPSQEHAWIVRDGALSLLELQSGALTRCALLDAKINHMVADAHGQLLCVSEDGVAWLFGATGERLGCWGHPLALTQAAIDGSRALVADERGWWGALEIER